MPVSRQHDAHEDLSSSSVNSNSKTTTFHHEEIVLEETAHDAAERGHAATDK